MRYNIDIEYNTLFNVIYGQKYEYMSKIHSTWMCDNLNKELYINFLQCIIEKKEADPETLKTYINKLNLKDTKKIALVSRLNQINKNGYIYDCCDDLLKENYKTYKINELKIALNDDNLTLENKQEKIDFINKEMHKNIRQDEVVNYQEIVNSYIQEVNKNLPSYFKEKSIMLETKNISVWGRWIRPHPICIASRPRMDKTSILLNLVTELMYQNKIGYFQAFEDSTRTLINKILAIKYNWDTTKFMDNDFTNEEKEKLKLSYKDIKNNKLWINDKRLDINKFRIEIDRQFSIRDYDYIMLDYFQLFKRAYWKINEAQEYDLITAEFISICKDYKVPIIFTSQVNDRNEKDGINLHLGNLKGSGGLEQNVRQAIFINGEPEKIVRDIVCQKNTYGGQYANSIILNEKSRKIEGVVNND